MAKVLFLEPFLVLIICIRCQRWRGKIWLWNQGVLQSNTGIAVLEKHTNKVHLKAARHQCVNPHILTLDNHKLYIKDGSKLQDWKVSILNLKSFWWPAGGDSSHYKKLSILLLWNYLLFCKVLQLNLPCDCFGWLASFHANVPATTCKVLMW